MRASRYTDQPSREAHPDRYAAVHAYRIDDGERKRSAWNESGLRGAVEPHVGNEGYEIHDA